MITRFICPFCRKAVVELDSGYDPATVEALLALHLEAWHPIRRRLSRRVRTALRQYVPVCATCGKSYEDGAHTDFGFAGADAHDYTARGVAA